MSKEEILRAIILLEDRLLTYNVELANLKWLLNKILREEEDDK